MESDGDQLHDDPFTSREPNPSVHQEADPHVAASPEPATPVWSAGWSPTPSVSVPADVPVSAPVDPPADPTGVVDPTWSSGRTEPSAAWTTPAGPPPVAPTSAPAMQPPPPVGGEPPLGSEPSPRRRPAWFNSLALVVVTALLAGAAGAGLILAFHDDGTTTIIRQGAASTITRSSITLSGATLDVAGVVAKAGPSVVTIQTEIGGRFGGEAAGTGIILTADGEIVTNAHVIEGATTIKVTLAGEVQAREAKLVGSDTDADIAVLQLSGVSGLTPADLGDSSTLQVGDDVVAIGNALALRGSPTVTKGIVSALDRTLDTGTVTMTGLLQTDASISSGNSGGPLVNALGKVIGIDTAVATSTGTTSAENIGFAIPINSVMPVVQRLKSGGSAAAKGYLGVRTTDPTDGSRGTLIVGVESGSPADAAGLKANDLVVSVGGHTVDGAAALAAAVKAHVPGDKVAIIISRNGQELTLEATLGTAPNN
jgi:S1-C subfamily serine protease